LEVERIQKKIIIIIIITKETSKITRIFPRLKALAKEGLARVSTNIDEIERDFESWTLRKMTEEALVYEAGLLISNGPGLAVSSRALFFSYKICLLYPPMPRIKSKIFDLNKSRLTRTNEYILKY